MWTSIHSVVLCQFTTIKDLQSSKFRSSIAHTHTQSHNHQNLRVPKLSGLLVPKILAILRRIQHGINCAQHIKTNPVPKPRKVSSTRTTPLFCSFIQHPGDVTVCAADTVPAGGRGDGNTSALPTQWLAYTSSPESLCVCQTMLHQWHTAILCLILIFASV